MIAWITAGALYLMGCACVVAALDRIDDKGRAGTNWVMMLIWPLLGFMFVRQIEWWQTARRVLFN